MELASILKPTPKDTELIADIAHMMGESFLEENWTQLWLSALDRLNTSPERRLEISRAIMQADFTEGAPYGCCYSLEDISAATGAYRKQDLGDLVWSTLEDASFEKLCNSFFTSNEAELLYEQAERMRDISIFDWEEDASRGEDFIHFWSIGVDKNKRGSGAFRTLIGSFLNWADEHGTVCFLETYSKELEGLYAHFGFETIQEFSSPRFGIYERCMQRKPQIR